MEQSIVLYPESAILPDYIEDEEIGKEAITVIMGILVSHLPEKEAYYFMVYLPEYLSYQKLRELPHHISTLSPDDCINLFMDRMSITEVQAEELIFQIIRAIGTQHKDKQYNITEYLPAEWKNLFQMLTSKLIILRTTRINNIYYD
ncbi:MAG TPA: hypothetical protein VK112_12750 [Fodinibius sp.]|nr:hypothetical protein [Fodinibius sp.]